MKTNLAELSKTELIQIIDNQRKEIVEQENICDSPAQESKYKRIVEHAQEGIWEIDENSSTVFVNKSMADILGYTTEEMLGKHLFDFMDDRGKTEAAKNVERRKEGEKEQHDFEFIKKNGERVFVTIATTPLEDSSGNYSGSIAGVLDITERIIKEKQLQNSEQKLSNIYKNTPAMLHSIDKEGKIVSVSDHWLTVLGYKEDEIIGEKSTELLSEKSRKDALEIHLPDYFKKGYCVDVPYQFKKKNGEIIDVLLSGITQNDENGNFERSQAVLVDITERKKTEQRLQESSESLKNINSKLILAEEISKLGFWELDIEHDELFWSDELFRIFGYSPGEIEPSNFLARSHVHPNYLDLYDKTVEEAFKNGTGFEFQNIIILKDGLEKWVNAQGNVVLDSNNQPIKMIGTIQDITAIKTTEDELRTSKEKLNLIIESSTDMITHHDLDGRYTYYSGPKKSKISSKDIVGKMPGDLFTPIEGEIILSQIKKCIETRESVHFESNIVWNGEPRVFDEKIYPNFLNGKLIGVTKICSDITEKKIAENELSKSKKRYQTLFQYSPIPLWEEDFTELFQYITELKNKEITDFRTHFEQNINDLILCSQKIKIIDINEAAIQAHDATSKEELLGNLDKIFTENSLKTFKNEVIALAEGVKSFEIEGEVQTLKGEKKHIYTKVLIDVNQKDKIIGLLASVDITKRKKAEEQVIETSKKLRNLSQNINKMRESERADISREIHDVIGQDLTSIKLDVSWIKRKSDIKDVSLISKFDDIINLVDETTTSIQKLAMELRPGILDDFGLVYALKWQVEQFKNRTEIECTLSIDPDDFLIYEKIGIELFRIVQEALTNVSRHAKATKVKISLSLINSIVELKINDNGIGINNEDIKAAKSLGILGITERVYSISGYFKISGKKNIGTEIYVSVPLNKEEIL